MSFLTPEEIRKIKLKEGNVWLATLLAGINVTLGRLIYDSSYELSNEEKRYLSKLDEFLNDAEQGVIKNQMKMNYWWSRKYHGERESANFIIPFTREKTNESGLSAIIALRDLSKKIQERQIGEEELKYMGLLEAMSDVYMKNLERDCSCKIGSGDADYLCSETAR